VAAAKAARRGHPFVGTEHVLLGILSEPGALACRVLVALGVEREVEARILEAMDGAGHRGPGTDNVVMAPASDPAPAQQVLLRSPEELLRIGFERASVVIVNECHNGMLRSRRTRAVGRRLLPAAHEAGVRHLAMEALTREFADEANLTRRLPHVPVTGSYLAQPDMRDLIADALALGWALVPYECEFHLQPGQSQDYFGTLEFANWRDAEEARNLAEFLDAAPLGAKLLVWCGNSHQRKTPQQYRTGGTWIRLGQRLAERGVEPFVIDQSVTVEYRAGTSPRIADVERFRAELAALGGTAGFLREDDPDPRWQADLSADAYVLSVDNAME
jgi:ClpA/ClpB-like protein